jgi:hypothetical protein
MPPRLDRTDRRILTIAGGVFLALVIGASLLATGSDLDIPTSYSAASGGARAAYLLLKESGYKVDRWERPLDQLGPGARTTLILADPSGMANLSERAKLQQFVSGGGRLVVTGNNLPLFLADNTLIPDPLLASGWKRAQAVSPAGITRASREITIVPQAYAAPGVDIVPLYSEAGRVVVAKYAIGNGEVIWWASATPLTNAGIREPGNIEFFLACVGQPGDRTVVWDEYVHGFRQSLVATASQSSVVWLFVQAGVLALAVLLTFSRRSGPILVPRRDTRLSPLEFVQTLGGLYQRARVASVAVDICHQRFRDRLTRRLGVPRDASPEHLARALKDRWGSEDADFVATLDSCAAAAANPAIKPKQALRLVQALYSYATKLKLYGS